VAIAGVLLNSASGHAEARTTYFIAVGYNGVPAEASSHVSPLEYADDDALGAYRLAIEMGHKAAVLTIPDVDSSARFTKEIGAARPPTLHELRRVVEEFNVAIESDRRRGRATSLVFFYSGHGTVESGGSLTFADGSLAHAAFYREFLEGVRADVIHLVIDACHAEDFVRPRDLSLKTEATDERAVDELLARQTLAGYGHVGAIIAAGRAAQAHEWRTIQGGVLTHEVISALRGAADVNGDGEIAYSEMAAFLSAANKGVVDERARPRALVIPPRLYPTLPILSSPPQASSGIAELSSAMGPTFVEDRQGTRLASFHIAPRKSLSIVLPAETDLLLVCRLGEAALRLPRGQKVDIHHLTWRKSEIGARGVLSEALDRGLFAERFDRSYYSGFVEHSNLASVQIGDPSDDGPGSGANEASSLRAGPRWPPFLWGISAAAGLGAFSFGGLAMKARTDYLDASSPQEAESARGRYGTFVTISVVWAAVGVVTAIWAHQVSDAGP